MEYWIEFNGTTSLIDCGSDATLDDLPVGAAFIVDCWVKGARPVGAGALTAIVSKDNWWLQFEEDAGGLLVSAQVGTDDVDAFSQISLLGQEDQWHHLTLAYNDLGDRTIYLALDGEWAAAYVTQTAAVGVVNTDAANDLFFGSLDGASNYLDGGISWLRISTSALYTVGVDFTPPPRCLAPDVAVSTIELWQMNEGAGVVTVAEMVSPNNDGAMTDCTWHDCIYLGGEMTRGIEDLRQLQICFQTDCATVGPPTARLIGTCGVNRETGKKFPTNPVGLMSKNILGRPYDLYHQGIGPLATGDDALTYQQIIWWLSMGTVGGITPAAAAPVYTWTFVPDLDDGDLPDVAHIIYGDNAAQWEGTCGFGTQTRLSAAFQSEWSAEMDTIWQNWDNEGVAFEVIEYPSPLDPILGQMVTFYLNTTCSFAAPTPMVCYLIDWTLTIPGFHAKYFQDGTMDYNCYGLASRALTFEWTMEFEDTVTKDIVWDAYRDNLPIYVRLQAIGPVIPASVPDTNYSVTIDMVLQIREASPLDSRDGNDTIRFVAETVYDVDCVLVPEWQIVVVNDQNALPACGV